MLAAMLSKKRRDEFGEGNGDDAAGSLWQAHNVVNRGEPKERARAGVGNGRAGGVQKRGVIVTKQVAIRGDVDPALLNCCSVRTFAEASRQKEKGMSDFVCH